MCAHSCACIFLVCARLHTCVCLGVFARVFVCMGLCTMLARACLYAYCFLFFNKTLFVCMGIVHAGVHVCLCACVCKCAFSYACVCVLMCVCVWICMCAKCVQMCMHACVYSCACAFMCAGVRLRVCRCLGFGCV
ncbi:hypothetical protein I3843_06G112800 [Carya illinoinensis]|nr:hypothetical protein I3843_06G112800 [Carya illinoinensis]